MRKITLIACLLFFTFLSFSQDSLSVLFIGNSYVYTNDLPNTLKSLSTSKGDVLTVASKTNGGYTFQNHVNDPVTFSKIHLTDWHYVILQGQSQEPSFPYDQVNTETLPYAVQLADSVYANAPCSQVVYFMTWGRQNGDSQWDSISTFDKMNTRLRNAYLRIADSSQASVAPAGPAWKYVRDNYPNINLFSADASHPSVEGTYLNACVFYSSLFHKSPEGATFYDGLDTNTAIILQQVARMTVLDSLDTWKLIDKDSLTQASISSDAVLPGATFQFYANASHADSYMWYFGDDTFSNLENPSHTFTYNGNMLVELVVTGPCGSDTSRLILEINSLGLNELQLPFSYYSDAVNQLQIKNLQLDEVRVFSQLGQELPIKLEKSQQDTIVQVLSGQPFVFQVKSQEKVYSFKFPIFSE